MNNQFTKQELFILKQHIRSNIIYSATNESHLSNAYICTGGELLMKITSFIQNIEKNEKEIGNEAKEKDSTEAETDGKTETTTTPAERV